MAAPAIAIEDDLYDVSTDEVGNVNASFNVTFVGPGFPEEKTSGGFSVPWTSGMTLAQWEAARAAAYRAFALSTFDVTITSNHVVLMKFQPA